MAIRINPNYADIHAGRGEAKLDLNDFTGAKVDFQKALQLVREQGKEELSVPIEERLQELKDIK